MAVARESLMAERPRALWLEPRLDGNLEREEDGTTVRRHRKLRGGWIEFSSPDERSQTLPAHVGELNADHLAGLSEHLIDEADAIVRFVVRAIAEYRRGIRNQHPVFDFTRRARVNLDLFPLMMNREALGQRRRLWSTEILRPDDHSEDKVSENIALQFVRGKRSLDGDPSKQPVEVVEDLAHLLPDSLEPVKASHAGRIPHPIRQVKLRCNAPTTVPGRARRR